MSYLITQSLISSWNYLFSCTGMYEHLYDSAYESFMQTLNRVPTETTPEMQNGIDFENLCYTLATTKPLKQFDHGRTVEYDFCKFPYGEIDGVRTPEQLPNGEWGYVYGDIIEPIPNSKEWLSGAWQIVPYLKNAQLQVKLSSEITVNGLDLYVFGILDGLKEGVIYDVKFSNKSFHSADLAGKYLESPQHPTYFQLCPEAKKFIYLVSDGEDLYTEIYTPKITRPFTEIASEFLTSIEQMGLLDVYKEKWQSK